MHMNVGQFVYEHAYIFSAILLLPLQGEQFSPYSSMAHENFWKRDVHVFYERYHLTL